MPILLQPINKAISKKYNDAQVAVMSARDQKTHVVTEALYGIRQIKFSAIEKQWQCLIMESRGKELKLQLRAYIWVTLLSMCWMCMPILLSAVAFGVYAWLSETLLPSIAFTSLSVYTTLEFSIGSVPIYLSKLFDARISSARIQQHLEYPDQERSIYVEDDCITFEDASITWSRHVSDADAFTLHDVNLQFPRKGLRYVPAEHLYLCGVDISLALSMARPGQGRLCCWQG